MFKKFFIIFFIFIFLNFNLCYADVPVSAVVDVAQIMYGVANASGFKVSAAAADWYTDYLIGIFDAVNPNNLTDMQNLWIKVFYGYGYDVSYAVNTNNYLAFFDYSGDLQLSVNISGDYSIIFRKVSNTRRGVMSAWLPLVSPNLAHYFLHNYFNKDINTLPPGEVTYLGTNNANVITYYTDTTDNRIPTNSDVYGDVYYLDFYNNLAVNDVIMTVKYRDGNVGRIIYTSAFNFKYSGKFYRLVNNNGNYSFELTSDLSSGGTGHPYLFSYIPVFNIGTNYIGDNIVRFGVGTSYSIAGRTGIGTNYAKNVDSSIEYLQLGSYVFVFGDNDNGTSSNNYVPIGTDVTINDNYTTLLNTYIDNDYVSNFTYVNDVKNYVNFYNDNYGTNIDVDSLVNNLINNFGDILTSFEANLTALLPVFDLPTVVVGGWSVNGDIVTNLNINIDKIFGFDDVNIAPVLSVVNLPSNPVSGGSNVYNLPVTINDDNHSYLNQNVLVTFKNILSDLFVPTKSFDDLYFLDYTNFLLNNNYNYIVDSLNDKVNFKLNDLQTDLTFKINNTPVYVDRLIDFRVVDTYQSRLQSILQGFLCFLYLGWVVHMYQHLFD